MPPPKSTGNSTQLTQESNSNAYIRLSTIKSY
jgi:hypothetical protein